VSNKTDDQYGAGGFLRIFSQGLCNQETKKCTGGILMDISAVMNIHELAMTKTIRQQVDAQERQEKMQQHMEMQEANQAKMMENKTRLEDYPGAFTNQVEHQADPQAVKNRVERQVDAQAAKQTVQFGEEKGQGKAGLHQNGTVIDIVT